MVLNNGLIDENPNSTESPYTSHRFFACSLEDYITMQGLSFSIDSSFYLTNDSNFVINKIEVDFNDGQGFVEVMFGDVVTPSYGELPDSVLTLKVKLTSGSSAYYAQHKTNVLVCNGTVPSPVAPPWSNTNQFQFGNIVANETNNPNGHAIGNAYVYYRDNPALGNENLFKKPLIVVEGIDFGNFNQQNASNFRMGQFGWCALWGKDLVNYPQLAKMDQLLTDFHNDGYDIIMLDFKNGTADIRENAFLLQALIEKVNQYKTADAGANVVLGASMGAIVSRYALADMERDGKKHCTRTYVSFDGPHQGANIPLGAQHFINFFAYNGVNNSAEAQNMMTQLSSPAAKQLLIYQISQSRMNVHDAFYQELDNLGYPTQCKNIAIANGSFYGNNQGYSGGSKIVDYNHTASGLFNLFVNGNIWALPGRSSDNLIFHGQMPFFTTSFLSMSWGSVEQKIYINNSSTTPHYDNAPGGVRQVALEISEVDTDGNGTIISLNHNQCFIPSISALDIITTDLFIDIEAGLSNNTLNTPFDAVYGPIDNTFHVEATDGAIPNRGDNAGEVRSKTNINANVANPILVSTYNYGEPLNNNISHTQVNANGKLYLYGNLVDAISGNIPSSGSTQSYQLGNGCISQTLEISNGGEIILGDAIANNKTYFYINAQSEFKIASGGELKVNDGSKLIIEPNANFIFEDGATIELLGNNAILEIKGKVTVSDNTDLTFTGSGKIVMTKPFGQEMKTTFGI